MNTFPEMFGNIVFDDATMKVKIPKEKYKAMKYSSQLNNSKNE